MPDNLEQELAALTPIHPSPALEQNIAHALAAQISPRHDRLLLSAITTALAASLLIATLLLTDSPPTPSRPDPAFTLADTPRLLAQLGTAADVPFAHPSTSPGVPQ